MMRTTATPAQIEALQRGESVELLARMEPQPERVPPNDPFCSPGWRMDNGFGASAHWAPGQDMLDVFPGMERLCPVAVGDTVEVSWRTEFSDFDRVSNVSRALSIQHRETDGVHYWVIEVSP